MTNLSLADSSAPSRQAEPSTWRPSAPSVRLGDSYLVPLLTPDWRQSSTLQNVTHSLRLGGNVLGFGEIAVDSPPEKTKNLKTTYDTSLINSCICSPAEGTRKELAQPEEH